MGRTKRRGIQAAISIEGLGKASLSWGHLSQDMKEVRGEPSRYLGEECSRLRDQQVPRS